MPRVILGLGSNIGDRAAHLRAAVALLRGTLSGVRLSRVLESKAVLLPGAPAEWNLPFLNMAVSGETTLAPFALLAEIKRMEKELGRMARDTWAPREVDIDILAYGTELVEEQGLRIPHPYLLERDFALLPLTELWPDWKCPVPGEYLGWEAERIAADCNYGYGQHLAEAGVELDAA